MGAPADLTQTQESLLLEGFLRIEPPNGYRAELIDGEIFITGVPAGRHELCLSEVVTQIVRRCPEAFDPVFRLGLRVPSAGGPENRVVPDVMLAPAGQGLFRGDDSWISPDGLSMVVEVTGPRPERDREAKRYGYARAGIPLYLLVDRDRGRVVLFSRPYGKDYGRMDQVTFGKPLSLPKPFDIELDTSEFA